MCGIYYFFDLLLPVLAASAKNAMPASDAVTGSGTALLSFFGSGSAYFAAYESMFSCRVSVLADQLLIPRFVHVSVMLDSRTWPSP